MRVLLRPLLLPLLKRDPREIDGRSTRFEIERPGGRELVKRLGFAFLSGFNKMLSAGSLEEVSAAGRSVDVHFRPFFFEGSAMGYLPRGYLRAGLGRGRVEADLLAMDPAYLYLYYVGLGFWYGFRHPKNPEKIQELAAHVNPLYFPLCYDGFGFKLGFFDFLDDPGAISRLERCPEEHRGLAYQGFGRSLFFVYMDAPEKPFEVFGAKPGEGRGIDLEIGRSLATGFTGADRPAELLAYIAGAPAGARLGARLLGITWALTARKMNDSGYFDECLSQAPDPGREFLAGLPALCEKELSGRGSYVEWQAATRDAALQAWGGGIG